MLFTVNKSQQKNKQTQTKIYKKELQNNYQISKTKFIIRAMLNYPITNRQSRSILNLHLFHINHLRPTSHMNTLTPRQYLVEISLIALTCQPSSQISKALCELHYGQSYVRFKTHPQIAPNGVAHFKRQTICVPYSDDIALVFKKSISSKSDLFLGHYKVEVEDYLQKKVYFTEGTQKLYETQTYVTFQCKIIDKQQFAESQTQDLSQCQSVLQKSQYSVFDQDPVNFQHQTVRESHSQYNSAKRNTRQPSPFQKRIGEMFHKVQWTPMLQEEFSNKLYMMEHIVEKKRMVQNQQPRLEGFRRNAKGELKSAKITKLEKLVEKKNEERIFNSLMAYVVLALVSLFVGVVVGS